jgi:hypothetical protein
MTGAAIRFRSMRSSGLGSDVATLFVTYLAKLEMGQDAARAVFCGLLLLRRS